MEPGKFRSELRSACPSIKAADVEWIIAYFVSALAEGCPMAEPTCPMEEEASLGYCDILPDLSHYKDDACVNWRK